jgi:hypothetical protein
VKIVQDFFVLLSLVCPSLVGLSCIYRLSLCSRFVENYYFLQLVVLLPILFVSSEVLIGVNAFW